MRHIRRFCPALLDPYHSVNLDEATAPEELAYHMPKQPMSALFGKPKAKPPKKK